MDGAVRFATIQLACYVASCVSMILYALHFAWGFPMTARLRMHNACEIVLLVCRGLNEALHGKLDQNDVLHHSVFVVGSWIVYNVAGCASFCFLLSHMQCLHFPMVLWYAGCRRSLFRESRPSRFEQTCSATFPTLWVFCVAYRAAIMSLSLLTGDQNLPVHLLTTFLVLLLVIIVIDRNWTSYFLKLLGSPSSGALTVAVLAGVALGALVLAVPAA